MQEGTIRRLVSDRNFGFIRRMDGADLFFHGSDLQGAVFAALREGLAVGFEIGRGRDGRLEAVKVRLAKS